MTLLSSIHRQMPRTVTGRHATTLLLILAMLAPPPAVFATDWGLEGYSYRKEITISHTNVDGTLTDFPLLVKIAADTGIGAHARSDGHDLRFTSATGTLLAYERESFESGSGSGSGIFWVKVPTISSSADTTIYLYYGKSDATDGQDRENAWDSDFRGVWHMGSGVTLSGNDSTSYGNDATPSAGPSADSAGLVGTALSMNLSGELHKADGNSLPEGASDRVISGWINTTYTEARDMIVLHYGTFGPGQINAHLFVGTQNQSTYGSCDNFDYDESTCTNTTGCNAYYNEYCADGDCFDQSTCENPDACNEYSGSIWHSEFADCDGQYETGSTTYDVAMGNGWDDGTDLIRSNSNVLDGNWHHVVGTYNSSSGEFEIYVDGSYTTSGTPSVAPNTGDGPFSIANTHDSSTYANYSGLMDEVRISASLRSAAWHKFEYNNISSGTNELTWASEESASPAATPPVVLLVNTEALQTIDDSDATSNISLKFGETLNKSLSYNRALGSFQFDDDLAVTGNVNATGNLAASGGLVTDGNAVIHGTLSGNTITSATLQNISLDGASNAISNIGTGSMALRTAQIRIPMKTATVEVDGTDNAANVFIGSDAGNNAHQYYAIKTGESAQQDLTIKVKIRVPRDFVDFGAGNDLSYWYKNTGAGTSDSKSDILVEDKDGDDAFTAADGQALYNAAWTEYTDEFDGGSFNPAVDEFLYITVKGYGRYDSGYLAPFIGEIVLTYRAR
ncbi:MAG: DUF2341 domain-containing protein [Candidatus Peribacteraceae bacterium]|nr:DUF2341 domain-containing protein [Candidatus Peribacteraceae bacterium]MDD5074636.1 DUF2341 domain-containing protein [Candidatus Peribacteraceae bacterium]